MQENTNLNSSQTIFLYANAPFLSNFSSTSHANRFSLNAAQQHLPGFLFLIAKAWRTLMYHLVSLLWLSNGSLRGLRDQNLALNQCGFHWPYLMWAALSKSKHHKRAEDGRDIWRSSGPSPANLQQVTQVKIPTFHRGLRPSAWHIHNCLLMCPPYSHHRNNPPRKGILILWSWHTL